MSFRTYTKVPSPYQIRTNLHLASPVYPTLSFRTNASGDVTKRYSPVLTRPMETTLVTHLCAAYI